MTAVRWLVLVAAAPLAGYPVLATGGSSGCIARVVQVTDLTYESPKIIGLIATA